MKKNRIYCKGVNGKYVDKEFEIDIGECGYNTKVLCNGKSVSCIESITIEIKADSRTMVTLTKNNLK